MCRNSKKISKNILIYSNLLLIGNLQLIIPELLRDALLENRMFEKKMTY